MRKICLTVIGMYLMMLHAFSQGPVNDSSVYKPKKLKLDEVNIVSSYYGQTADKSAVMGGRIDSKGIGNVTDLANGLDIKFVSWDKKQRKNALGLGFNVDYHTAASQAYVDSNGKARNNGTRIYPTLDWSIANTKKGTEFGLGLYYSAEHNYYRSIGINTSFSKKTKSNGEIGIKLVGYFDNIKMIKPAEFSSADSSKTNSSNADSVVYLTTASGGTTEVVYQNGQIVSRGKSGLPSKTRDTYTAELSFDQVINSRMQASVVMDLVYQDGYLGLPFHRVYFNNGKDTIENLPSSRFKLPIGFRLNYFLGDNIILRGYYRFYFDSWGLISHTASLEVPVKITPFFSLSPFYRYYSQTAARYFAAYAAHNSNEQYYTSNYALAAFSSHSVGLGIRLAPPNGVLIKPLSMLEIRYAHYQQTTDLAADVLSLNLKFK